MARPASSDPALAAALKHIRERQGLTQEALAHDAGITVGTLSKIELGQTSPAWVTVKAIADALGVTMIQVSKQIERETDTGSGEAPLSA